ncbi:calphotin-like [Penaeus chinensis]|uniref:calphotin-like n=1 Tax=Penaeus chinensis TaxID=139456 RepID=UPI001FB627F4|nr:calphotin-like [Penaeus chinensis]
MQFLILAVLAASCSAAPQMFRAVSGELYLLRSDIPSVVKIPEPGINLAAPLAQSVAFVPIPAHVPAFRTAEVVASIGPVFASTAGVAPVAPVVVNPVVESAVVSVSAPVVKSASVVVPVAPKVKSAEIVTVSAPVVVDPVVKSASDVAPPTPVVVDPVVRSAVVAVAPVVVDPVVKTTAIMAPTVPVVKSAVPVTVVAPPEPLMAPEPPMPSLSVPHVGGQFHAQDEAGQYTFGHYGGPNTRVESRDSLGRTSGSFAYVDPEGDVQVRKYAAAPGSGFRVAASDLVEDTPAVAQVKSAHARAHQAVKSLTRDAVVTTA